MVLLVLNRFRFSLEVACAMSITLFVDGHLIPNTEFAHLELHGRGVETLLSGALP
jgi:hypothetical protein